ncbi:P-loop containing nucleoside triphosphate hydrolase protein [Trichoderma ceciliae]
MEPPHTGSSPRVSISSPTVKPSTPFKRHANSLVDGSSPVIMLPPRNTKFFGRKSILAEIENKLLHSQVATEPAVLTLNGLGGIGKSQIARQYAYRWKEYYHIILWISSETALSLDQSLREAAAKLGLDDASQRDSLRNKVAVLDKLEQSDAPWLVIFDNLDDASVITGFWPHGGQGSIIVTSVISDVIFNFDPYEIKVPPFSEEEAVGCLLKQLSLDDKVGSNYSSALKLNKELGGLPLGIVRVAAFIRSCKIDIEECAEEVELALNKARDRKLPARYDDYLKDLSTVWNMSFKKLSENPQAIGLLGMLSFLAAETIPEELFTPKLAACELSTNISFCSSKFKLKSVEGDLLDWALIEKDAEGSVSLHRLVQKEIQHFLTSSQRQLAFDQITFLLYHAFPKQVKGQYLHHIWEQGNRFVNHVVMLNRHYLDTSSFTQLEPSLQYIQLLSNCAWLLFEKGSNLEAQELLKGGLDAYEKLRNPESNETEAIYAHMLNTNAILDGIRGYFDSAINKYDKVLKIRGHVLPENDEEVSGILNNLCLAYESAMRFEEAFLYREKSLEICWKHPASTSRDTKVKKRDLAASRLLLATGRLEDAKDLFPGLLEYFQRIDNWFLIGQLLIPWGNYYYAIKDFRTSKEKFLEALKQYEEVGQVKYHPDAIACLYKIGRVALEEGDAAYAIERLREALKRLRLTDPTNPQIGRVCFMLGKALLMTDAIANKDEIEKLEREVWDILQTLRPQRDVSTGITEALLDSLVRGVIR